MKQLFEDAYKPAPEVLVQLKSPATGLGANDLNNRIKALADVGVTRVSIGAGYKSVDEFRAIVEIATQLTDRL